MEIKQTGEFRAQERSPDTIVLSKFLLSEVYDLPEGTLTELMVRSASFRRGNDPRLQHFVGVEPEFVRVESSRRWRDARQRREFGDRRAEVRVR
ncbi:hypothetical protein [Halococcus agarilyticus]|uniref:hypothetical protein n=1 Tax=Halococcus agarilyticus TaxID=1232219 RepID=UPI001E62E5EC|nr:hypothetical protein [Halococcus agarilyticus]